MKWHNNIWNRIIRNSLMKDDFLIVNSNEGPKGSGCSAQAWNVLRYSFQKQTWVMKPLFHWNTISIEMKVWHTLGEWVLSPFRERIWCTKGLTPQSSLVTTQNLGLSVDNSRANIRNNIICATELVKLVFEAEHHQVFLKKMFYSFYNYTFPCLVISY